MYAVPVVYSIWQLEAEGVLLIRHNDHPYPYTILFAQAAQPELMLYNGGSCMCADAMHFYPAVDVDVAGWCDVDEAGGLKEAVIPLFSVPYLYSFHL